MFKCHNQLNKIGKALNECDLFLAIGTSGVVYPAAGFAQAARQVGACTPSAVRSSFTKAYYGKASETVPKFVDELLEGTLSLN